MKKVSVVTISFNQAEYLRQCIDSVLSQDYPALEYIVVDPGSVDGSKELIASYGEKIIPIFEKDQGPADGLNRGFARASGDIFCYINSDDYFRPGAILSAVQALSRNGADMVYGHAEIVDDKGNFKRMVYSDSFDIKAAAYGRSIIIQPSSFFLSSAFQEVNGFNILNKSNWDGELIIEMAMRGKKFSLVNEVWSAYRVHGSSITGTGKLAAAHSRYRERMYERITGRPHSEKSGILDFFYTQRRRILNFRDSWERLKRGPVFKSGN